MNRGKTLFAQLMDFLPCGPWVPACAGTTNKPLKMPEFWRCMHALVRKQGASAGSRPTSNSRHCRRRWQFTKPSMPPTAPLNRLPRPRNLLNRRCLPSKFQQRPGQPPRGGAQHVVVFELIHREVFRAALVVDTAAGAEKPGTWSNRDVCLSSY